MSRHDQAIYSMWNHFAEVCKRARQPSHIIGPAIVDDGKSEELSNKCIGQGRSRLPVFVNLSTVEPPVVPTLKPLPVYPSAPIKPMIKTEVTKSLALMKATRTRESPQSVPHERRPLSPSRMSANGSTYSYPHRHTRFLRPQPAYRQNDTTRHGHDFSPHSSKYDSYPVPMNVQYADVSPTSVTHEFNHFEFDCNYARENIHAAAVKSTRTVKIVKNNHFSDIQSDKLPAWTNTDGRFLHASPIPRNGYFPVHNNEMRYVSAANSNNSYAVDRTHVSYEYHTSDISYGADSHNCTDYNHMYAPSDPCYGHEYVDTKKYVDLEEFL
jgi:hypothetical protein